MSRKIGAHVSSAGGPLNAITNAKNINANCLQIFAGSPRTWTRSLYPNKDVTLFNQTIDYLDLRPVFIHALYLVNLASDTDITQKSYLSLKTDLQNGDAIQAAGVIVHLGSHQGRGFTIVKDQLVTQIRQLLAETSTTAFIIENSAGQQGKIGTLEEISFLLSAVDSPRLKVCLDTAHLFAAGYDLRSAAAVDDLLSELEQRNILHSLVCLHLNDSKSALGSRRDLHENLGDGQIGLEGLANFVSHPRLAHLPLILEVPGQDGHGPDAHNVALARSLVS